MIHDDLNHPDEGTIHAWLDDGLSADEAARIDAHVATCASCSARVAEARGLIAGASRVLSRLDDDPMPLIRPAVVRQDIPRSSLWGALRITPARAAIAAMLLVSVGVFMTQREPEMRSARVKMDAVAPVAAPAPSEATAREQVAARLKDEQPPRALSKAAGNAAPTPPAASSAPTLGDINANEKRVAAARQSLAAQADTVSARADHARLNEVVTTRAASPPAPAQAVAAGAAAERTKVSGALQRRVGAIAVTQLSGCYRVEAADKASAKWGDVAFPFIVAFDSTGVVARVLTPNGEDTQARAVVTRSDADSLNFRLRRIGFNGSLVFGSQGPTRSGFAKTLGASEMEQNVFVTARSAPCPSR